MKIETKNLSRFPVIMFNPQNGELMGPRVTLSPNHHNNHLQHQNQHQQQLNNYPPPLRQNQLLKLQAHKSSFQSWKCVSFGCSLFAIVLLTSKWHEVSTDLNLLMGINSLLVVGGSLGGSFINNNNINGDSLSLGNDSMNTATGGGSSLSSSSTSSIISNWPPIPLDEATINALGNGNGELEAPTGNDSSSSAVAHMQLSLSRELNGNQLLRQEIEAFIGEFKSAKSTLRLSSLLVSVYVISWILMTLAINDTRISNDISLRNILLLSVFGAIDLAASSGFVMVRIIMYSVKNNPFVSMILNSDGLRDLPTRLSPDQLTAFTALRLIALRSCSAYVDMYASIIVAALTLLRLYAIMRALSYYRRLRRFNDESSRGLSAAARLAHLYAQNAAIQGGDMMHKLETMSPLPAIWTSSASGGPGGVMAASGSTSSGMTMHNQGTSFSLAPGQHHAVMTSPKHGYQHQVAENQQVSTTQSQASMEASGTIAQTNVKSTVPNQQKIQLPEPATEQQQRQPSQLQQPQQLQVPQNNLVIQTEASVTSQQVTVPVQEEQKLQQQQQARPIPLPYITHQRPLQEPNMNPAGDSMDMHHHQQQQQQQQPQPQPQQQPQQQQQRQQSVLLLNGNGSGYGKHRLLLAPNQQELDYESEPLRRPRPRTRRTSVGSRDPLQTQWPSGANHLQATLRPFNPSDYIQHHQQQHQPAPMHRHQQPLAQLLQDSIFSRSATTRAKSSHKRTTLSKITGSRSGRESSLQMPTGQQTSAQPTYTLLSAGQLEKLSKRLVAAAGGGSVNLAANSVANTASPPSVSSSGTTGRYKLVPVSQHHQQFKQRPLGSEQKIRSSAADLAVAAQLQADILAAANSTRQRREASILVGTNSSESSSISSSSSTSANSSEIDDRDSELMSEVTANLEQQQQLQQKLQHQEQQGRRARRQQQQVSATAATLLGLRQSEEFIAAAAGSQLLRNEEKNRDYLLEKYYYA